MEKRNGIQLYNRDSILLCLWLNGCLISLIFGYVITYQCSVLVVVIECVLAVSLWLLICLGVAVFGKDMAHGSLRMLLGFLLVIWSIGLVLMFYAFPGSYWHNMAASARNSIASKPVLYLYPEEEQEVSVTLLKPGNVTCSYPKYVDGWDVLAQPDGTLIDVKTSNALYCLYYEANDHTKYDMTSGFVVKGEECASFLEDALAVLGLTEREAEEFIIYWLPKLEANKYNLIHFATEDEIASEMPVKVVPEPDNFIRVLMVFKGLDEFVKVEKQELVWPARDGFVAVEWGGVELN